MKRARMTGEGGLTGGTGDTNPQWLSFSATQSAADTTTTTTQAIPIQRLPSGGRSQILEILRVHVEGPVLPASASATETSDSASILFTSKNFGTTAINSAEPTCFSNFAQVSRSAFTAAGTYFNVFSNVMDQDLTDGAGHGVLIATDNIFAQTQSASTGNTNTWRCKILYRWKNVGLAEYIGLVQSQQ